MRWSSQSNHRLVERMVVRKTLKDYQRLSNAFKPLFNGKLVCCVMTSLFNSRTVSAWKLYSMQELLVSGCKTDWFNPRTQLQCNYLFLFVCPMLSVPSTSVPSMLISWCFCFIHRVSYSIFFHFVHFNIHRHLNKIVKDVFLISIYSVWTFYVMDAVVFEAYSQHSNSERRLLINEDVDSCSRICRRRSIHLNSSTRHHSTVAYDGADWLETAWL